MPAHKKGGRTPRGCITCRGSIQWQARLRVDGVAHVKSFETKDKAQAWIDRLLEARKRPDRFERALAANAMTLAEAMRKRLGLKKRLAEAKSKRANRCKTLPQQIKTVERLIKNFPELCGRGVYEIDEIDIRDFINARLESGMSNATINRELALISNTFNIAKAQLNCTRLVNPIGKGMRLQEDPGRSRRLEADEEAALMREAALYEVESDVPIGKIIKYAAESCMRISEVSGMDWRDVDLVEGTVFLFNTKNGQDRTVPLSLSARALLQSRGSQESGKVWGEHEAIRSAWRRVRNAAVKRAREDAKAGVKGAEDLAERLRTFRFHDLRHEGTSRLIEETDWANPKLKVVTGQKSDAMLARYSHVRAAKLAAELAALKGGSPTQSADFGRQAEEQVELPQAVQLRSQWRAVSSSAKLMAMLVERQPILNIAEDFGISDAAVHKACARLGVQKKNPGFWLAKNSRVPESN